MKEQIRKDIGKKIALLFPYMDNKTKELLLNLFKVELDYYFLKKEGNRIVLK